MAPRQAGRQVPAPTSPPRSRSRSNGWGSRVPRFPFPVSRFPIAEVPSGDGQFDSQHLRQLARRARIYPRDPHHHHGGHFPPERPPTPLPLVPDKTAKKPHPHYAGNNPLTVSSP